MHPAVRLFLLFPVAAVLSACAQLSAPPLTSGAERAPDLAVGDQIMLRRALEVLPGTLNAWFDARFYQAAVPSLRSVLFSDPLTNALRCGVRLRQPLGRSERALTLEVDTLTVKKIVRGSEPLGIDPASVSMQGDFSTDVVLKYRIDVVAEDQPHIEALFCSQRYALLNRGTPYPALRDLQQQAGSALSWPLGLMSER